MSTRRLPAAVAASAILALVGPVVSSHAVDPCTTSWANAGGGDWNAPANWSAGVPTSGSVACITLAGTYTVRAFDADEVAKSLHLGGETGTQTLQVGGTDDFEHGRLVLAGQDSGHGIEANGRLLLGEQHVTAQQVARGTHGRLELTGMLVNRGAIISGENLNSPNQWAGGSLDNQGTLSVVRELSVTSPGQWTTSGTITIDQNKSLTIEGAGSNSFTQTAGTITATGLMLQRQGTFTASGGTATGKPIELEQVTIVPNGTGTGSFQLRGGNDTLGGDIGAGYTLRVAGRPNGVHGRLNVTSTRISHGTLLLGDFDGTQGHVTVSAGAMLDNRGTVRSAVTANGANRFSGDLLNQGTLVLDNSLDSTGPSQWTTSGTLTIGSGSVLTLDWNAASSFSHSAGSLTNSGTFIQRSGSFTAGGAGTATGTPLRLENVSFSPSGTGTGSFELRGASQPLATDIGSGYTVRVAGVPNSHHGSLAVATARTNHGTLLLGSTDGTHGRVTGAGLLINEGTLRSTATGGSNHLDADLDNRGMLAVDESLNSAGSDHDWTSGGAITVASTELLNFDWDDAGSFTQTGGTFVNDGRVLQHNGTVAATGDGTQTGGPHEIASGGTLVLTGTGSGAVRTRAAGDVLAADVAAGYTIHVAGHPNATHGRLDVPESRTNHGTIVLGVGDTTHGVISMAAGKTLTNAGTLRAASTGPDNTSNGPDTIVGPLINTGTVQVDETLNAGPVTSSGTVSISAAKAFAPQTFVQTAGSTTVGSGATLTAATGPLDVQGGRFGGTGTAGPGLRNGGTVDPGSSPGTLTLTGNFEQLAGGVMLVDVEGPAAGQHDVLSVGGAVTLAGTVRYRPAAAYAAAAQTGDQIPFLSHGGPRSGAFAASEATELLAQKRPITTTYDDAAKLAKGVVGDPVPDPVVTPTPTPTPTATPTATPTPVASPTPTPVATPTLPALRMTAVRLAKRSFTARKGTTLRLTLTVPARVVVTARRRGKPAIKLRFSAKAGPNALKLASRKFKPGRYTATVVASDALGRSTRPVKLAFTVKRR